MRAFGLTSAFISENAERVNNNVGVHYTARVTDRWLSVRLEMMANLVVAASAFLAIWSADRGDRDGMAGLTGFALTYALSITGVLGWVVR